MGRISEPYGCLKSFRISSFDDWGFMLKQEFGECLKQSRQEIDEMKGVFREPTFCQLSLVIAVDKELKVPGQRLHPAREASGFAR
jgi:hypothetical protein